MCEKIQLNSSTKYNNSDTGIVYVEKFDEYGVKICDGATSYVVIEFCPWCGKKLPNSKKEKNGLMKLKNLELNLGMKIFQKNI